MSLRILFAIHGPADPATSVYGGVSRRAEYLRSLGHSVDLVTPSEIGMRMLTRLQPLLFPLRIATRCNRVRYDVVIFHSYAGWAFHLMRRWMNPHRTTASIMTFHGLEPLYHEAVRQELARMGRRLSLRFRLLHTVLLPRLTKMSARRSTAVLCLNERERTFLVAHHWCRPERLFLNANGVEKGFFISREYAGRGRRLLFLGQWLLPKGIRCLVEAFTKLAATRADVSLVCGGTVADTSTVLAEFPEDVRSRVAVHPRLDRSGVLALMAEADVFLFPSLSEGSSGAVLEAMASGLPMVTTRAGAAQDFLEDGTHALLVPFADGGALAAGAARLLDDPELRQRLADNARAIAERHEWSLVNAAYADLLVRVAGQRAPGKASAESEPHDAIAR